MKKALALILSLLMLSSCTAENNPDDTAEKQTDKTDSPVIQYPDIDLDNFEIREIRGYLSSSLTHAAQIADYRGDDETFSNLTAPLVQMVGDKTYILRRFPEEAVAGGRDTVWDFECGKTAPDYVNEIEVYTGHDYTADPEIITLTGHSDRMLRFDNFEYSPETDTFLILQFNYALNTPRVLTAHTFDGDGNYLSSQEFAPEHFAYEISRKVLMDGSLYFTYGDALFRYEIETGEETMAAPKVQGYTAKDSKLLYVTDSVNDEYETVFSLMEYDPDTHASQKIGDFAFDLQENLITGSTPVVFDYDAGSGMLYFTSGASSDFVPVGVRANRLGEDSVKQIIIGTEEDHRVEEIAVHDGYLTVQMGNNQVEIYEIPGQIQSVDESMVPLRFCLSNTSSAVNYQSDVFRLMEMSGYNAKPEGTYLNTDPEEYAFTMAKKLLAGDTDFDIFMVTTEMAGLLKEGYYENLAGYDSPMAYMNAMIPGMKELCTVGSTPALIPVHLSLDCIRYTGTDGIPKTFSEFAAMADSIPLSGDQCFLAEYNPVNLMMPWFRQVAASYMARDMDNDQVTDDLALLFETAADLASRSSVVFGKDYQNYSPAADVVQNNGKNGSVRENQAVGPIVPVRDGYGQVIEGSFYAVNPNSPNKELAAVFLTCHLYTEHRNHAQFFDTWAEDMHYAEGSEDLYALYREQIASGVLYYDAEDLQDIIRENLTAVISGTMTPDDAADALFRYLKMEKNE